MKFKMLLIAFLFFCTQLFSQDEHGYFKHAYISTGTSFAVSGITYSITHKKNLSVYIGTGTAILANVLKEYVFDKNNGGVVNHNDVLWGSVGSVLGGASFRIIINPSVWKEDLTPEQRIEIEEREEAERLLKLEEIPEGKKRQSIFNYYNKEHRIDRRKRRRALRQFDRNEKIMKKEEKKLQKNSN